MLMHSASPRTAGAVAGTPALLPALHAIVRPEMMGMAAMRDLMSAAGL